MRIGVVIPYYQREPGILRRALASIAGQELPADWVVEVVVVDDASPCPPGPEIAAAPLPPGWSVTLLAQPNGGPGAARNRALDHLAGRADLVAFLDSDDEWSPRHLAEAAAAIERGYGYYFCQNVRPGSEAPDGNDAELAALRRPGEPGVTWLDGTPDLIGVDTDRLLQAYLTAYLSQSSTMVLRAGLVRGLRFEPRLRAAGEDHLYWIDLALSGARAAISSAPNVRCGRGVNLYYSAFDFGSARVVERVGHLLLFWSVVSKRLAAAGRPAKVTAEGMARYRRAYSYLFLRAVLRGQRPSLDLLRRLAVADPLLVPLMPLRFLSVLPRREKEASGW